MDASTQGRVRSSLKFNCVAGRLYAVCVRWTNFLLCVGIYIVQMRSGSASGTVVSVVLSLMVVEVVVLVLLVYVVVLVFVVLVDVNVVDVLVVLVVVVVVAVVIAVVVTVVMVVVDMVVILVVLWAMVVFVISSSFVIVVVGGFCSPHAIHVHVHFGAVFGVISSARHVYSH